MVVPMIASRKDQGEITVAGRIKQWIYRVRSCRKFLPVAMSKHQPPFRVALKPDLQGFARRQVLQPKIDFSSLFGNCRWPRRIHENARSIVRIWGLICPAHVNMGDVRFLEQMRPARRVASIFIISHLSASDFRRRRHALAERMLGMEDDARQSRLSKRIVRQMKKMYDCPCLYQNIESIESVNSETTQ